MTIPSLGISNPPGWQLECASCVHHAKIRETLERRIQEENKELLQFVRMLFFLEVRKINRELWKDPKLADKLSDPNPLVRWIAAGFAVKKRIPAEAELILLLNDPYPEIRMLARQALVRISRGTDFGPQPLDSQAKINQASRRWTEWLDLQEPHRESSLEKSGSPKR